MEQTEKLSYNEAFSKLKQILERIKNDDMDVDNLSAEVKQATELIALCKSKLQQADQELQNTLKDLEV